MRGEERGWFNFFARRACLWGKKNDRSRSTKKCFSRLGQLNCFLPFCPNLSNCQSECEVCCSDVNVIPNLSIVSNKLVMVTLKLSELHSENRPILPCKQRFFSCMAFSVGSRSRRIWRQRERLKNNRFKGDVTRDDSQRRFLAQHSVATSEQCCNYSKQCRNNVVQCCFAYFNNQNNNFARASRSFVHFFAVFTRLRREIPNFVFYGERKQVMTKLYFAFWTLTWSLGIQVQEGSRTFDKVSK